MHLRLLAGIGLSFVLAACGGGGGGGGPTPSGSSSGGGVPTAVDRVSVTASGPAAPVAAGSVAQLSIVISNPATTAANNVTATATLGPGLTRGNVTCTARDGAVCPAIPGDFVIPTLSAGGTLEFTMEVLVAAGTSGAITSNTAVSAQNDDIVTNNSAQVSFTAYASDVRVTSNTSNGEFYSGSLATYSMTLQNFGPDAARNLALENVVGPGQVLSTITCSSGGGATCPANPDAIMSVPMLPNGGSLTFLVSASIAPETVGPISNTLHVTVAGDPLASNNVATSSARSRIPTSPQSASFVHLQSDAGDWVGEGGDYSYNRLNALLVVNATGNHVSIIVGGDEGWNADFALPNSYSQLAVGTWSNLGRYPFGNSTTVGGINVNGRGHGCNELTGTFTIDAVTYVQGSLASLDLRFEQACEELNPDRHALHGQIHWVVDDDLHPAGPVNPPPAGLWQPSAGATPASGNYIYLQSDGGDFAGGGGTYTYTQANSLLTLEVFGRQLNVRVVGDLHWDGLFQGMNTITTLQPGYYGDLHRFGGNPVTGGLEWSGNGGCNQIDGWFVIDGITYSNGALATLDLRFEQHCEGDVPALRGKIHWTNGDTTQPPGPVVPPPAGLWQPAAGATPASGNYVYMTSEGVADYVGLGLTHTYTQANSVLQVEGIGGRLRIGVWGDEDWSGDFQAMQSLPKLQVGYYGSLSRYPFHNPVGGGLSWSGDGRGCNQLSGWFVVDSISYSGDTLTSIDLRFEQHCEFVGPALNGKIHWAVGDTTAPPGPVNPPPANLWQPAAGATPATGNYVYLQSDQDEWVGAGGTYTYTQATAILDITSSDRNLSVHVRGDEEWRAQFRGMNVLDRLEPGYYGDIQRFGFGNPVRGGMDWSGESRGCNEVAGWIVVDSVSYSNGSLASIDLRFEQICGELNFSRRALHGKIHWVAGDPTAPPGPVNPPPAGLWQPAAGATPASGNYVYLQSDPGDFVGAGQTYTITPATHSVTVGGDGARFSINMTGPTFWNGNFVAMNTISQLQPGYYANAQEFFFHNPVKPGMLMFGEHRTCGELTGWFVVDNVTYSGGSVASIDLRFEQHCHGDAAALRGKIHWVQ